MNKPSALYRAREKTADLLRLASGLLPFPEALPMRLTRWAWQTTAKIIDVPPRPQPRGPSHVKPEPSAPAPAPTPAPAPAPAKAAPAGPPEIDSDALRALLSENPAPLLVDVREPHETAAGVIPGARLIPMNSVLQRIAEIREAGRPLVVVYCARGMRSANVTVHLRDRGVDARSLRGGIEAWKAGQGPIERPQN